MSSVVRSWLAELPLREQGTLFTAIRGCDLTPKYPLDSVERQLTAAIRYAILIPADEREVDSEPGCFMQSHPPKFKASALGHYPQHWVSHLMHASEVIGYRHPDVKTRTEWLTVYVTIVHGLHLNIETPDQFERRLSEDRIATGTVVS